MIMLMSRIKKIIFFTSTYCNGIFHAKHSACFIIYCLYVNVDNSLWMKIFSFEGVVGREIQLMKFIFPNVSNANMQITLQKLSFGQELLMGSDFH